MKDFTETLNTVKTHGYTVNELPGVMPFSEEQKKNFIIKQILMRIATGVGEIATLSEPEVQHTPERENMLKESVTKLFINILRLAKSQNIDEERLTLYVKRLIAKA